MNILLDIFLWKVLLQISFGILILGFFMCGMQMFYEDFSFWFDQYTIN